MMDNNNNGEEREEELQDVENVWGGRDANNVLH